MALAKLCPVCCGCGRTSISPIDGKPVPQSAFTGSSTSAQGWTKCQTCGGIGVVALIDGDRFANGLSVDEYIQRRLGAICVR